MESDVAEYKEVYGYHAFNKLRTIFKSGLYNCYLYCNAHSDTTYWERRKDVSHEELWHQQSSYACNWYVNHVKEHVIQGKKDIFVKVLVDDEGSEFEADSVAYMREICQQEEGLRGMYALLREEKEKLVEQTMEKPATIVNGRCMEGKLSMNEGRKTAFVNVRSEEIRRIVNREYAGSIVAEHNKGGYINIDKLYRFGESEYYGVFIKGVDCIRPGIHGDKVIVAILPYNQWSYRNDLDCIYEDYNKEAFEMNDVTGGPENGPSIRIITGRVISVMEMGSRDFVCSASKEYKDVMEKKGMVMMMPMNPLIPACYLKTSNLNQILSHKHVVRITDWPEGYRFPNCQLISTIGEESSFTTDSIALLYEAGLESHVNPIPHRMLHSIAHVSMSILEDIHSVYVPSPEDLKGREDIRETHNVVSIDPPGCVDIDDACSVRVLDDCYEIGVHIADVCYYVLQRSPLDKFAQVRSTSVYLVDRRIDMLPPVLSTNICSLRADYDRLAISIFVYVDKNTFNIIKPPHITRTILRSRYSLAYPQAQALAEQKACPVIENPYSDPFSPYKYTGSSVNEEDWAWLGRDIRILMNFGRDLRNRRRANGAVELVTRELRFQDAHDEEIDVRESEHLEIHETIEELMVVANSIVAQTIYTSFPSCSLLRKHEPPPDSKLRKLQEICEFLGLHVALQTNKEFASSIALVKESCSSTEVSMLMLLFRKHVISFSFMNSSMSEAKYVCTGEKQLFQQRAENPFAHYGLGIDYYTHYTSPIRRYADIIVHRLLLHSLEKHGERKTFSFSRNQGYSMFDVHSTIKSLLDDSITVEETGKELGDRMVKKKQETIKEQSKRLLQTKEDDDFFNELMGNDANTEDKADDMDAFFDTIMNDSKDDGVFNTLMNPVEKEEEIEEEEMIFTTNELTTLANHINQNHRKAKRVSQQSNKLYIMYYIRHNQPQIRSAVITQIYNNGIAVEIPFFDLRLQVRFLDAFGKGQPWFLDFIGGKKFTLAFDYDARCHLADSEDAFSESRVRMRIVDAETTEEITSFSLYQCVNVNLSIGMKNKHTMEMSLSVILAKDEGNKGAFFDQDEKKTIHDLIEERTRTFGEKKYPEVIKESSNSVANRKDVLAMVEKMRSGVYSLKKYDSSSHMVSRYQFGGFVTSKTVIQEKWEKEFAYYNDEDDEEEEDHVYEDKKKMKEYEMDATSRVRMLKSDKRDTRIKKNKKKEQ